MPVWWDLCFIGFWLELWFGGLLLRAPLQFSAAVAKVNSPFIWLNMPNQACFEWNLRCRR